MKKIEIRELFIEILKSSNVSNLNNHEMRSKLSDLVDIASFIDSKITEKEQIIRARKNNYEVQYKR